ncbi:MAG: hypothetical protein H5T49_04095 [Hadesarchaea archaeon]|nr:hypothetical protein [Hadesarchaea archaeon]
MTKKKISKEGLEKLIMIADTTLDVALNAPAKESAKETLLASFSAIHYYFVQLTLRALKDRELAEQLIPIFTEAETYVVTYTNTLSALCDVLRFKHGIKGVLRMPKPGKKLDEAMEKLMEECPYEQMKAAHEKYRRIAREEESRPTVYPQSTEENIMYR